MATEIRKELIDKYEFILTDDGTLEKLNVWECSFLEDINSNLYAEDGFLTELQIEKLEQIYEKYS